MPDSCSRAAAPEPSIWVDRPRLAQPSPHARAPWPGPSPLDRQDPTRDCRASDLYRRLYYWCTTRIGGHRRLSSRTLPAVDRGSGFQAATVPHAAVYQAEGREAQIHVALPRILLVIPGLVAGLLLPAIGDPPKTPPANAVGMDAEVFDRSELTVDRGARLTLVNNSRVVHVIGPGRDGRVVSPTPGMPRLGSPLLETDSVEMTDAWERPGTYYLTCSVHPKMTIKVMVAP